DPPAADVDSLRSAADRLFPGGAGQRQRLAALVAACRWFSVLAGGPGTGKTTAVARLLALFAAQPGRPPRVALAAPTGKAKGRLQQATAAALAELDPADAARVGHVEAVTLHRLLGASPHTNRFRFGPDNRLPHDLVVVDEASMIPLTMMARLLGALRDDARLVLVGDPDQLASVEAGAVLGDLVARPAAPGAAPIPALARVAAADLDALDEDDREAALQRGVVRLREVHRFVPAIGDLADAVRRGDAEAALALLRAGGDHVEFCDLEPTPWVPIPALRADVVDAGTVLAACAAAGDARGALAAADSHRLLCAHREGPAGIAAWNTRVERWIAQAFPGYAADRPWYLGRPVLVLANDYSTGLFNGDCGVLVDGADGPRAAFERDGAVTTFAPYRVGGVQTAHALTVHRAQGSQFDAVTVLVPPPGSRLLARELLYTAITRARTRLRVVGTAEAVAAAVRTPVRRASGLRLRD
ncbi:MAG: exodeoxyribonuclease V subunit alpha, partial [Jatrophihabitans sp.]